MNLERVGSFMDHVLYMLITKWNERISVPAEHAPVKQMTPVNAVTYTSLIRDTVPSIGVLALEFYLISRPSTRFTNPKVARVFLCLLSADIFIICQRGCARFFSDHNSSRDGQVQEKRLYSRAFFSDLPVRVRHHVWLPRRDPTVHQTWEF